MCVAYKMQLSVVQSEKFSKPSIFQNECFCKVLAKNIDLYKIAYVCAKNALQFIQVYLEHEVVKKLKVVTYISPMYHLHESYIIITLLIFVLHVSFVRRFNDPLCY